MRVVTVENFGGGRPEFLRNSGYIYEGECWAFRFQINSEEHFFKDQIPNLIWNVFKIDPRQIMRLVLYGKPGLGLFDARVYISFETPPEQSQMESLKLEVQPSAKDNSGDTLDGLLLEVLKDANPAAIESLTRSVEESVGTPVKIRKGKKTSFKSADVVYWSGSGKIQAGGIFRLRWEDECTPCLLDWNNANFLLAEALRDKYKPQNVVRFEFRAVPDTEAAYEMEAEVFVEGPPRLHPIRLVLKGRRGSADVGVVRRVAAKKETMEFVPEEAPRSRLIEAEQKLLDKFNRLPMEARLAIWQKHIARFFK